MNEVINIEEKLNLFSDLWSPKRIEKLNGQQVILAKVKGEFVFHSHDLRMNYSWSLKDS